MHRPNSSPARFPECFSSRGMTTSRIVPGSMVLRMTITGAPAWFASVRPICSHTRLMYLRSMPPFDRLGVPTQTNTRSLMRTASATSLVARSRPRPTCSSMISGRSFSMIGERPELMRSTLVFSGSTPMISWPSFARQAADTAPTYPSPRTQIFIAARMREIPLADPRTRPEKRSPTGQRRLVRTVLRISGIEAAPEGAHPLLGSSVGEGVGHHPALHLLLQPIVADGVRRGERLLEVARAELPHRARVVSPHAGIAIGLQLVAHRSLGGFRPGRAGQLLHVVPDLVRDHVGLGEVARRAKARLQLPVEGKVDVELLVAGAVERPHRRLADAAGRAHLALVEHQRRGPVLRARALEDGAPDVLGAAEHLRDELAHVVRRRALGGRPAFLLRGDLLPDLDRRSRIEAEQIGDDRHGDAADAEPAADHADAAAVLDVRARALVTEFHAPALQLPYR